MDEPDYLVCVECETPCYMFEFKGSKLIEAVCEACGADEPEDFMTPEDYEALEAG